MVVAVALALALALAVAVDGCAMGEDETEGGVAKKKQQSSFRGIQLYTNKVPYTAVTSWPVTAASFAHGQGILP